MWAGCSLTRGLENPVNVNRARSTGRRQSQAWEGSPCFGGGSTTRKPGTRRRRYLLYQSGERRGLRAIGMTGLLVGKVGGVVDGCSYQTLALNSHMNPQGR